MAAVAGVPVVNLLSDRSHPLQAIADLLTLRSHWGGKLAGRRVAWVGDGNNVARSLALACAMAGAEVSVASPPGHGLDEVTVDAVAAFGGTIVQSQSPAEAVEGADAVCTDVWVSMGQEAESVERMDAFRPYQVGRPVDGPGRAGCRFPALPAGSPGQEVTAEVIDGPASLVWPQAANRLRAMRGLLLWMFGQGRQLRLTKTQRQHRVSQILEKEAVTSQAELVRMLGERGVEATQVTVSTGPRRAGCRQGPPARGSARLRFARRPRTSGLLPSCTCAACSASGSPMSPARATWWSYARRRAAPTLSPRPSTGPGCPRSSARWQGTTRFSLWRLNA